MKHKLKTCLLIATAVGFSSSLTAEYIKITSPQASTGYLGVDSEGTSLTTFAAGTWTFQVGMFSADPTTADISEWGGNWTSFQQQDWIVSPTFAAGRIDAQWTVPDASPFTGNQAYIWGFNNQAIEAGSEWVLVTNDTWEFPEYDALSVAPSAANTWDLSDGTNDYVFGSQSANGFATQQVIPEPSTYALIFGLGILGFLGFRRFRK